jgi:hypothetical protein
MTWSELRKTFRPKQRKALTLGDYAFLLSLFALATYLFVSMFLEAGR